MKMDQKQNKIKNELTDFCNKLFKCRINNKDLIFEAFTHSSYAYEYKLPSNERLEFLGDSVVGLTVANYLYSTYPLKDEGFYSKIRSSVVSAESFSEIAEKLNLTDYLLYNTSSVKMSNTKKLYANLFEAIVGALYLDKGFKKTESFILRVLKEKIDRMVETDAIVDYKSALSELTQKRKSKLEYVLIDRHGPDHAPIFRYGVNIDGTDYGEGVGVNKAEAQAAASRIAYIRYKRKGSKAEISENTEKA